MLALNAEEAPPTIATLPRSGHIVEVPTFRRHESRWKGPTPASFAAVPNKPPLNFEGLPTWAEFVLVRLLERSGWEAVWVKNWAGRAFWRDVESPVELPQIQAALFQQIETLTAARAGCWDIFAWRAEDVLFIESKQRRRDRLRPSQQVWLEAALESGVPLSAFAAVEWDADHFDPRAGARLGGPTDFRG
jgi:hypothetical protein